MPKKRAPRASRPELISLRRSNGRPPAPRPAALPHIADTRFLWSLLDGLEVGVAAVSPAGVIRYANSRFVEMLQSRAMDEVVGSSLDRFVSPSGWPALNRALAMAATDRVQGQMEVAPRSGPPRAIQLSLMPVHASRETIIMLTATDLTELVEKNKALRATEDSLHTLSARILQLQDQERRRIARDLHDITGQELAVIIMSLNRLANNLGKPEVNAQEILSEAVALVHKVEDEIRTLSYVLHPPLLDEFGLRSALNWYAEGFTKRSGVHVTVETPREVPRLSTEKETALFRVVQESLTNVLRHSSSAKARIEVRVHSDQLQLCVEDEGQGISREALEKIIEGTAAGVGTRGMRERIQQLGGTLKFSARAKGTRVIATLPIDVNEGVHEDVNERAEAMVEAPPPEASQTAGRPSPASKTRRILIVDDHDVTRQGIRSLLQAEPNIEICGEAQNGLEAVAKARELDPDLIILDISMPGAGGFSAAMNLRNAGSRSKILFFTTHTYYEIERMSRASGYAGLVTKTNAARDLVRAVRAVLAGHRFYNSEVVQEGGGGKRASKRAAAG